MSTATQTRSARAWRIGWAEEELRRFDDNMQSAFRACQSTLSFAMASTGCDNRKASAGDHLSDMFSDVFGDERHRLLCELDEAGGDPTRFPWPLGAVKKDAA